MRNRIVLVGLFLLFFIGSCKNKGELVLSKLEAKFNLEFTDDHYVLLLVPLNGCGKCIQPTISFLKKSNNYNNLYCIISDFGIKEKMIQSKGIKLNVILDSEGFIYSIIADFKSPIVFFIKNKSIKNIEVLTSSNSKKAFIDIKTFLNEGN